MEIVFELVQIFICILEAYLMIDFFSAFFPPKEFCTVKYGKAGLILGAAACVYTVNRIDNPTVNVVAMQVIYGSIIMVVYQGKLLKKALYYITATAIMVGSEFLCIIILSLQTDFSLSEVRNEQIKVVIPMLWVKLIAFVLFNVVKRIAKNSDSRVNFKIALLYSIMPISLIGIMISVARMNVNFAFLEPTQILLMISCTLAMIGNVIIFYVFDRYTQSTTQLQQQEMMIMKLELEKKHYEQIEQVNQEHAAFLHDIHHYMKTIGEMASENNDEEILKILSELRVKVSDAQSVMLCHNRLLNAILNEKKKEAERKNIAMTVKVEPNFCIDQIGDADLIVIMGNLLDNAIEAAEKCQDGYLKIYLFEQNDNHFSVIKVVNNYIGEIISEKGRLRTGKADKARHGFGLRNVNEIAEKYGGYLQYFHRNGEFISIIILPTVDIS